MEHLSRITDRVTNMKNHHSSLKQSSDGQSTRGQVPRGATWVLKRVPKLWAPRHLAACTWLTHQHPSVYAALSSIGRDGFFWTWCRERMPKVPLSHFSRELLSTGSEDVPGQPFFRTSSISSSSSSGRSWSRLWRPNSWRMPAKASWFPLHGGSRHLHLPLSVKTGVLLWSYFKICSPNKAMSILLLWNSISGSTGKHGLHSLKFAVFGGSLDARFQFFPSPSPLSTGPWIAPNFPANQRKDITI